MILKSGSDRNLIKISKKFMLSLDIDEMKAIKNYFIKKRRNPTRTELETIAAYWSEHCRHKTLTQGVDYLEFNGNTMRRICFKNLLNETIFKATKELNKKWCISVFKDNSGIIEFDKKYGVCFKVETHNHPSSIEPYGGAATGVGGAIRDILGTGLGAVPVGVIDVFVFGEPLYALRIVHGVVRGVSDYANRVGIPPVAGAVYFDNQFLYNPLVFAGSIGLIPKNKCFKKIKTGDVILIAGGKTGKDGVHGATFSSMKLKKNTPPEVVQIGDPLTQKKLIDAVLEARDKNLYSSITDLGAGGLATAVPEMVSGARIYLDKVPLKFKGLKSWQIWISESQERMLITASEKHKKELLQVFKKYNVDAAVIGRVTEAKKLEVFYKNKREVDIDIDFLNNGLPYKIRKAVFHKNFSPSKEKPYIKMDYKDILLRLLSDPSISSKHSIIRQYDFEVQGNTVIKPFCGINSGPSDGSVIWPFKDNYRGIVIGIGINPQYGRIDPYWMAASSIDEALRNVVAAGGDIKKTALLDNLCAGSINEEELGRVVRILNACYRFSKLYSVPFISGKDSLNNEYSIKNRPHSITPVLLISAVSVIPDIRKTVTADFKSHGNLIYIVGMTEDELGGSAYSRLFNYSGNDIPHVNALEARKIMLRLHKAIREGIIKSCHDCSDGGVAVALSEMCIASLSGATIYAAKIPATTKNLDAILFSETNSRFIVEVEKNNAKEFERIMKDSIVSFIGVVGGESFRVYGMDDKKIIDVSVKELSRAWKQEHLY